MKACTKCGELKPLDQFSRNARIRRDGLNAWCKPCHAEYHKAWKRNRWSNLSVDERREENRKWALKTLYGITVEQYDERLAQQDGGCAICGRPDGGQRERPLYVDHDHATGAVRGLLCAKCNSALGYLDDDPNRLLAAAAYLLSKEDILGKVGS